MITPSESGVQPPGVAAIRCISWVSELSLKPSKAGGKSVNNEQSTVNRRLREQGKGEG